VTADPLRPGAEPPADVEGPGVAERSKFSGQSDLPWRRLATGMLLVEPAREIIKFIPLLIALIFAGRAGESGPPWGLIGTAAVIALGISRWLTTRYRITPTVIEVRKGLLQRKHLTVPRDRVRTVDVSAHPLQRVLGLVKVQIGTGTSHHGAELLALDGLRASTSSSLRAELLHHAKGPTARPAETVPSDSGGLDDVADRPRDTDRPGDTDGETELARLDPRWIGFAPATLSGVVTAAVLIGFGWRILNEAQLDPAQFSLIHQALRHLSSTPVWVDVLQGGIAVLIVITLLSVAGYLLSFWGYRLTRHAGGTLGVSRGLLTTRSTSIEERRLHGLERSEPLLLRVVGGARLQAIATGLRHRGSERGGALLVPPAPLRTVLEVETKVLGSAEPGHHRLIQHGPAARRRRYTRALGLAGLIIVALFGLTWWTDRPPFVASISLLLLPLAALLAGDRYRNLGHALVNNRLITGSGSVVRRHVVLAVPGVIGLTIRQSMFQRRGGLVSVTATTAAGSQHYEVPDVPVELARPLLVALLPECGSLMTAPATKPAEPASVVLRDASGVSRLPA
jgi:putative membrane protein